MDVTKMKVPELRAELGRRGLNTFGTRQVLIDRLNEAMEAADKTSDEKPASLAEPDEPPCIASPVAVKSITPDATVSEADDTSKPETNVENGVTEKSAETEVHPKYDGEYKRRRSPSRSPRRRSSSRDRDSRDRDRRDRSPRRRSRSPSSRNKMCEEKLDWEKSESVFLDVYNCDLNLLIDAEGFKAKPQTDGGFSMMWAGVRANFGVVSGKAFYEVRHLRNLFVENTDSVVGGATHVVRVGWSTENAEFALGEEPQSYGYGGTGKKSCNNKFVDYGCTFSEGDVVGAFLEYTSTEAILRFSVNGIDQGECYRVQKDSLDGYNAFFPHIYVKNVEFCVNFGQDGQTAWYPPNIPGDDPKSWHLMGDLGISSRIHGRLPPSSKAECEVLMMIGLPGSGKTYYAERLKADNREKQYNVLGTNLILDKMKVMGLARQRNYSGRWDVLIDKATKCLNVLIGLAAMRRRNYILDQTNVYPSAQRRKMRPFEGFKRKAIVIVPTDEEFRRRIAQREKEEGKEVPESAVLEMKANFGIPKPLSEDSSSLFDEVIFTELEGDEVNDLLQRYNQEGQANRPPPEKRQRWEGSSRDRDSSDSRDSRFRGSYDGRDRGRDFNRGYRDDYHRSPGRRDDRGRDYRGGYHSDRDRSREGDRFDRNRDRDSYGRPPMNRYGGPGGRFGGPPGRGGYPGSYGGYEGSRGGMMMRGRGGPGSGMGRGGYGGPGYDMNAGPPMNYGGDGRRGRGGFRGGSNSNTGYGSAMDSSSYGGPQTRFDNPAEKASDTYSMPMGSRPTSASGSEGLSSTEAGSYRGAYGAPPRGYGTSDRGGYGGRGGGYGSNGNQMGRPPPGRGGRGAGSLDRDATRGGSSIRGASSIRGGSVPQSSLPSEGRGYNNLDSAYPGGNSDRMQSSRFSNYPSESYPGGGSHTYQGNDDYSNRSRGSTYGGGSAHQSSKNTGSFPGAADRYGGAGGYQRGAASGYPGGYSNTGYAGGNDGGYSGSTSGSYPGGYSGDGNYGASGYGGPSADTYPPPSEGRGGRSTARSVGSTQQQTYGSNEAAKSGLTSVPTDRQTADAGSLYASGAARYGEGRSAAPTQSGTVRHSRFDSKSPNSMSNPSSYGTYPPGAYQGSFPGGYDASAPPPSGTRSGRSRFDLGPGSSTQGSAVSSSGASAMAQGHQSQQPSQTSQLQQQPSQAYGYSYGAQSGKADGTASQANPTANPAANQATYGSYNYGYGYNAYGGQPQQSNANQNRSTSANPAQSLYASVVADKPQQSAVPQAVSLPNATAQPAGGVASNPSAAVAAYASYYGYQGAASSAQPGATDAAMAAAQQFNAWQQQQPTTAAGSTPAGSHQSTATAAGATAAAAAAAIQPNAAVPASYTNYYSGYSAYGSAYGSQPPATGTAPASSAQYYAGYR